MSRRLSELKPVPLDGECIVVRERVREFLREQIETGGFEPQCDSWLRGVDRGFSRKLGERGWLGMTWPKRYGGHERPQRERFVVVEELLAAGAPVAGHWVAERQIGPSILRHGSDAMKEDIVPAIARGECFFGACYSEPDVGSDLASVRTRARQVEGGWRLTGTKVWTSQAHHADYLVVLCRTSPQEADRHRGLSMLILRLPSERVAIRPILLLTGEHHFNEVVFDDAFVPDAGVLGAIGDGWNIITGDLAFERSGPERYMSTLPLFREMVLAADGLSDRQGARQAIGELGARLWALRSMSIGVAALMEQGAASNVEAALVKDVGTRFEGDVAEAARRLFELVPSLDSANALERFAAQAVLHTPAYTLRGGANEILRGIVARGLGLR